ncbi:MAG: hypothetical protein H6R27_2029 [Proteobacteria bacterium]|nr:hypothetical protein [Pseudomonadota bacterium]
MKFTLDDNATANAVTARMQGEVRIAGRAYRQSLVVTATSIVEDWPVGDVAQVEAALEIALGLGPDILILGTGERQVFPEPAVFAAVAARGIGFEVMDNGAACRTYNVLLAEGRNVALALIL